MTSTLTGFTFEELMHNHFSLFILLEDLHIAEETIERSAKNPGESFSYVFRIRNAQGSIVNVKGAIVNQLNDPNIHGYIMNFRLD